VSLEVSIWDYVISSPIFLTSLSPLLTERLTAGCVVPSFKAHSSPVRNLLIIVAQGSALVLRRR
jgi:hypothetical protein